MRLTQQQLSALPEYADYKIETLPTGETVRHRLPPKFKAHKTQPDDVVMFRDKDGAWFVDYHLEGGPYKRRAPF